MLSIRSILVFIVAVSAGGLVKIVGGVFTRTLAITGLAGSTNN